MFLNETALMESQTMCNALTPRCLIALLLISLVVVGLRVPTAFAQSSLEQLEEKLKSQYAGIEKEIAGPPAYVDYPDSYRVVLRAWQDRLSNRFAKAARTAEEIMKLDSVNSEFWRERLETLLLYSQPISRPEERTVFGAGEVKKRARIIDTPAAVYTDEARAHETSAEVRLRLVLASDGTVRNVFPIKSSSRGLTESAMAAARQINFQPAIRKDRPVSQFATFVYEFKKANAKPYIPRTVF